MTMRQSAADRHQQRKSWRRCSRGHERVPAADIRVSMFDAMMEWMAIPMLYTEYGSPPKTAGAHASDGRYLRRVRDRRQVTDPHLDPERSRVGGVLPQGAGPARVRHRPRFATNLARVANRPETDELVARCFAGRDVATLSRQLEEAQIAFARVNDVASILRHPHLRRVTVTSPNGPVALPATPAQFVGEDSADFGPLPALGEHTGRVRREFLG